MPVVPLAAWQNLCLHWSSEPCCAEEEPVGKLICCPHRAFGFASEDGRLVSTAPAIPTPDFDRMAHGLNPVSPRLCNGLLFLNLQGRTYCDHHLENGRSMSNGWFVDVLGRLCSVRNCAKISAERPAFAAHLQKVWTYYGLFPNQVFAMIREGAQFYHEIPFSKGQTWSTARNPDRRLAR